MAGVIKVNLDTRQLVKVESAKLGVTMGEFVEGLVGKYCAGVSVDGDTPACMPGSVSRHAQTPSKVMREGKVAPKKEADVATEDPMAWMKNLGTMK